jgi:hypothetical protein
LRDPNLEKSVNMGVGVDGEASGRVQDRLPDPSNPHAHAHAHAHAAHPHPAAAAHLAALGVSAGKDKDKDVRTLHAPRATTDIAVTILTLDTTERSSLYHPPSRHFNHHYNHPNKTRPSNIYFL